MHDLETLECEVQDILTTSCDVEEVTADDIYHWSEIFGISREEANKRIAEEMFRLGRTPAAWRKQREIEEKQKAMEERKNCLEAYGMVVLKQTDLYNVLPFGKTKVNELLQSGKLPVLKLGRDWITTPDALSSWIEKNLGNEIYF